VACACECNNELSDACNSKMTFIFMKNLCAPALEISNITPRVYLFVYYDSLKKQQLLL
jgi:hypothetical protein